MHKYVVSKNQQLTPSTVLLTLRRDPDSKPFLFQVGQYAAISFHRNSGLSPARCFSIVSSPTNQNTLQFSMRIKGRFTTAISQVLVGDKVDVRGPYGSFIYDAQQDKELVFVAGGIGITPFISMLQYAVDTQLQNKITLIYSCRSQDDVPFLEQLENLANRNANLRVIYVVNYGITDKLPDGRAGTGRVGAEILGQAINNQYAGKKYMLCGPPMFMNAVSKILHDSGVDGDSIITEAFNQGKRKHGRTYRWPMNIYIFGAIGLVTGSFAVMIKDLFDTLPPSVALGSASDANTVDSANSRQYDLDQLVNELPKVTSTAPATTAAKDAAKTKATNNVSSGQTTTTQPTPAPAPAPKCTTSQSGVTTCV